MMDDTISRQDAIDALKNMMVPYEPLCICISKSERDRTLKRAIDIISALPSAQLKAQLSQEDTTKSTTFDCISRESVYNLLRRECSAAVENYLVYKIRQLPSAQPEQKPGKWIYGEDEYGVDGYHCDKCGFFVPWNYKREFIDFIKNYNFYNFCPNCGADMRGEQE